MTKLYLALIKQKAYTMHMECTLPHICTLTAFMSTCNLCYVYVYIHASVLHHTSNLHFVFIRNKLQYVKLNSMYTFWLNFNLSIILLGICIPLQATNVSSTINFSLVHLLCGLHPLPVYGEWFIVQGNFTWYSFQEKLL